MKGLYLFLFPLLLALSSISQETKPAIKSVKDFFANVPLTESYVDWINYISAEPNLGIDSTNTRGIYSSLKKGILSKFPFPDNIDVKILASSQTFLNDLSETKTSILESIAIEGVFGNSKEDKKRAKASFEILQDILYKYYKENKDEHSETGLAKIFFNGISSLFPAIIVEYGYLETKRFYYVLLSYERVR